MPQHRTRATRNGGPTTYTLVWSPRWQQFVRRSPVYGDFIPHWGRNA